MVHFEQNEFGNCEYVSLFTNLILFPLYHPVLNYSLPFRYHNKELFSPTMLEKPDNFDSLKE